MGQIYKKNTRYKALCCVFLLLVMVNIGSVLAFDFDNVKNYNAETRTADIRNSVLGIPFLQLDQVAEATLLTPQVVRVIDRGEGVLQKVAEIEIDNKKNYKGFWKGAELYDLKAKNKKFDREIVLKYKVKVGERQVKVVGGDCSDYVSEENEECPYKTASYKTEDVYDWIDLEQEKLAELPEGIITIGLFTDVEPYEKVEWIPEIFGVRVEEWAVWTADLTEITFHAYLLDEGSGSLMSDSQLPQENITLVDGTPDWDASGKFNSSYKPDGNDNENFNFNYMNFTNDGFSLSLWTRYDASSTGYMMGSDITGSNRFYIEKVTESGGCYRVRGGVAGTEWGFECPQLATWNHWVYVVNTTWAGWYTNGTLAQSADITFNFTDPTDAWDFQVWDTTNNGAIPFTILTEMSVDEIVWFNTTLSAAQVSDLYNNGDGIQFERLITSPDSSPTVALNNPSNNTITSTPSQTFNCSAEDDQLIQNITLYVNGVANYTLDHGTSNFSSLSQTLGLADGNYNWTCLAADNATVIQYGWANANWTITVDTTEPAVSILYPTNVSYFKTLGENNFSLNFSASDPNLETCWYFNGTGNTTLTCGTNTSMLFDGGSHDIIFYANDTLGNENSTSLTFYTNYYNHTASYTNPAVEQEVYIFNLNVTADSLGEFNGTLYYNGTAKTTAYSDNGTLGSLTSSFAVDKTGNLSFNWIYYIDGNMVNASYSHIVNPIQDLEVNGAGTCTAGLMPAIHYDFRNEQNDTLVNATISYIFRYGVTNNTFRTTNGSLTNAVEMTLCINSTVWNNYSIGYGEVQYGATGYSDRRYYKFNGDRLSNQTINNTLLSLVSGSSTSFLFTIQGGDLSVYDDVYLTLNRWYPDEDTYKVTEMALTDDEGQTVMKVEVEDVDYRVGVYYKNGTLVYLAAPIRLVCIASPCSYTLTVPENAGNSFENWKDLQVSLTYNETTGIFTFIYNDPSQDTDTLNLTVYKETGTTSLRICQDTATGYTGVLTCNVSGYTGTLRAVTYRTASPETSIISKIVNVANDVLEKTPALFITVIVMIFLVSVGIVSPILTVILSILAFIPAMFFGVMPLPIMLILCAMGFIVIHFMKRSVS